MSTSICDFSTSGPSFHGDVQTGAGSGPCEAAAGDSAPGSCAFGQAFAKKLADLAAQRSPSGGSEACDGSQAGAEASAQASGRQEVAAQSAAAALDGEDGIEKSTAGLQLSPALSADGTDPAAWAAQAAVTAVAAVAGLQTAGILGASQVPSSTSGLTTVAVSPGLNVIQPAQSELDGQSLVAFARAQGLDDRAVQWLFGQEVKTQDGTQELTSPGVSGPVAAAGSTTALAASALNAFSLTSVSEALGAGSSPQAAAAMAARLQAQTQLTAQAEGAVQGTQPQSTQALLTPQDLAAQAVQSATASGVNATNGSREVLLAGATGANAVNGGNGGSGSTTMSAGVAGAAGGSATQAHQAVQALNWLRDAAAGGSAALWGGTTPNATPSGRGATPSPADPLAAIFNISKSLLSQNQRAGAASASSAASARAATSGARVTHATLDLVSSLDPELVEWLEARSAAAASSGPAARLKNSNPNSASFEGGAARVLAQWAKSDPSFSAADASSAIGPSGSPYGSPFGSTAPSSLAASAAARTLQSGLEGQLAHAQDRAQRLADRLGEAVGQRMLTELEKGNWQLNLKLRPESLGSIDIEMRMQAGQLNAQFTAHQALTRDLISDGLNRLKDTLAQMGMNVAQMNVNGGRSQQRGGDSTPRSSQGVRAPEATSNNQEADATTPSLRPTLRSGSGWDMLV